MDGVLLVHKPKNWTSRDVVNKICSIFGTKKVGHAGTLDPMATGVLVICIGKYTKFVELFTNHEKEYIATMKLGVKTDTKDITGKVIETDNRFFSKEEILTSFQEFPREYNQLVPIYSAVKVNGKKLYEYAREGKDISLPSRHVFLSLLEVLKIEGQSILFRVAVSKGTYIRSLIEDIAASLNTCATMTDLIRTKSGNFLLEDCLDINSITKNTPLLTMENLFSYPKITIDEKEMKKVMNGNTIVLNSIYEKVFLVYQNEVIAIYQKCDSCYKMLFKVK